MGAGGTALGVSIQEALHDGAAQLTADHATELRYAQEQENDGWTALAGGVALAGGAAAAMVGLEGAWSRFMRVDGRWAWEPPTTARCPGGNSTS